MVKVFEFWTFKNFSTLSQDFMQGFDILSLHFMHSFLGKPISSSDPDHNMRVGLRLDTGVISLVSHP